MIELLKRLWAFLVRLFRPSIPSENCMVVAYIVAGAAYGDACTYPGGFAEIGGLNARKVWGILEKEYAALGYRTVPIKNLIDLGGYGTDLSDLVWVERDESEEALLWEPNTKGPTPMGPGVLDRIATIGEPARCSECDRTLVRGERAHCGWCLSTIVRDSLKGDYADYIVDLISK